MRTNSNLNKDMEQSNTQPKLAAMKNVHPLSLYRNMKLFILTVVSLFTFTKQGDYQIAGPYSSKKPLFRFATQGPIPNVFSICPNTSSCIILDYKNNNTELYRTSSAASPYAFSSQILKKTLLTGFPTRLLDFSQGKRPIERATVNPSIIIHCVYSM